MQGNPANHISATHFLDLSFEGLQTPRGGGDWVYEQQLNSALFKLVPLHQHRVVKSVGGNATLGISYLSMSS